LQGLLRELTDAELQQSGTIKMILDTLDTRTRELGELREVHIGLVDSLKDVNERYTVAIRDLAVAKERMKHIGQFNWTESLVVGIGGILIGASVSAYFADKGRPGFILALGGLTCFILMGVIHRYAHPNR